VIGDEFGEGGFEFFLESVDGFGRAEGGGGLVHFAERTGGGFRE
jgi:hypothetical protein